MMTIGFLAELVIAYNGRHDDVYSVAERTFRAEEMRPKEDDGPQAMNASDFRTRPDACAVRFTG